MQIIQLNIASDTRAANELHTDRFEIGYLGPNDIFIKLETGDAIVEKPAGVWPFLVDNDLVPMVGQLFGNGEARRTAPHNRHTTTRCRHRGWGGEAVLVALPVSTKRLEFPDIYRAV